MMVIEIEGGKWVSATPRITPRNFGKRLNQKFRHSLTQDFKTLAIYT
jgi:hypothetical protein